MMVEPIAIVGRGCVLPGCFTPDALWDAVRAGKSLLTPPPPGVWGLSASEAALTTYTGGYVTGFSDTFDADRVQIDGVDCAGLDPVFQWSLKAALDAWAEAGTPKVHSDRLGVVLANLSYPSRSKADHAGDIWMHGQSGIDPLNAFNSGAPAAVIAKAIGASGAAFSLDAACASSLYALHIACRKLRTGSLDIAVVGGVNAADNLMLHRGFEALSALSPTGQSRPFSSAADGLVPAEGAAALVLKRVSDVEVGERVFGLMRATGLSNDGRRRGLLAPAAEGQLEAMQRAYAQTDIKPDDIQYLECHATGTPVGDGVEIRSAKSLFGDRAKLPIGSLKSNTGHLITVAGLASILKMLSAFEHETLPPTRLGETAIPELDSSCFVPQTSAEHWSSKTPRRAAISNFGFGGNNAHLVLEQGEDASGSQYPGFTTPAEAADILITGIGVLAGQDRGKARVVRRLMSPPVARVGECETLVMSPAFSRVPPKDLACAEAQQLAVLDVCEEALEGGADVPPERVGVFVGMGCASDSACWLLRERLGKRLGLSANSPYLDEMKTAIAAPIGSADVLGHMPNMPANRINSACDFRGQGFTISADGQTGYESLKLAIEALENDEIDMAVVAAADFAAEPVRASVLKGMNADMPPADLACAIVLQRKASSKKKPKVIFGTISSDFAIETDSEIAEIVGAVYGHAPIAGTVFHLGIGMLLAQRGQVAQGGLVHPAIGTEAPSGGIAIADPIPSPDPLRPAPALFWGAAKTLEELAHAVREGRSGGRGKFRLALTATGGVQLDALRQAVAKQLERGDVPTGKGVYFGKGAATGDLAFVYTGSAAAYPRMGRGLFLAFPEVATRVGDAFPEAARLAHLLAKPTLTAYEQLCAVTLLSQAHTILLRDMLGLDPQVAFGLSLGETNSLVAFKYWKNAGHLLNEIEATKMYEHYLGGDFETARLAWGEERAVEWANWRIYAPVETVRAVIADFPRAEITMIYSHEDVVIGGRPEDCKQIAARLGKAAGAAMNQHLIVHAEAMRPYEETWRALHTRPTSAKPSVRIYGNATNAAYKPTKAKVADMLTRQAVSTVDFPATIEQVYADGVRTFVEIGPRDTLAQSITKTLGDRAHVAVAADRVEASDLEQIVTVAAALYADGRKPDMKKLSKSLKDVRKASWEGRSSGDATLQKSAHKAPIVVKTDLAVQKTDSVDMPAAPTLMPPVYARSSQTGQKPDKSGPLKTVTSGAIPLAVRSPRGPAFAKEELVKATDGKISDLFGELFQQQDGYVRQVRLPTPPMLLVDRITGIDAKAGVDGQGTIWTETDIVEDAWYMHDGFMRPGPLIEAGQADLSLISWMGADFRNKDERVYRLLGCELTLHDGGLPKAGDKLQYQIEITGHATLSGVRMFFFQYDCYVDGRRLFSVRNGQAGFFTDEELSSGKGVLWDAAIDAPPTANPVGFSPESASKKRAFSANDLQAFRSGDAFACFGPGFEPCAPQTNPPRTPQGKLALIDSIPEFDPEGGPWRRGYLKAAAHVPQNAWFYDGHFHNDPCMPGTLMAEAAVQALEFYAAAIGMVTNCDGFVFEPMTDEAFKFVCRGQVIPDDAHDLVYEVFIDEVREGDTPEVFASLLATSDGKKVFHCPRFGIRLRRNWPVVPAGTPIAAIGPLGESRGDWAALKACGDGAPSDAFGDMYQPFDTAGRVPRLPQPPYHFVSRVNSISTRPNMPEDGAKVVTEYDIPPDAWYFADNENGAMPFAVLVEIVLQPCGWLASHGGFALNGGECFRNLDGDGAVFREIRPEDGVIRVEAVMTRFSKAGPMTIVFFELTAWLSNGEKVMTLSTSFGFFPLAALVRQAGLKIDVEQQAQVDLPSKILSVQDVQKILPSGRMRMLDGVDYFDPEGGSEGLGLIRGFQDVDPYAWYFKAHFYQDPVQPGSLGLDMLVQLLKRAVLLQEGEDVSATARFQSVAPGEAVKWSYRGQVTPARERVTSVIEIIRRVEDDEGVTVFASGSLWCDGLRIYSADKLSVRLIK